jgi:hypothetical protein
VAANPEDRPAIIHLELTGMPLELRIKGQLAIDIAAEEYADGVTFEGLAQNLGTITSTFRQ